MLAVVVVVSVMASAQAFARSVTIAWDPNPEPDVAGYIVYRGAACGFYSDIADAGNQTSYTFTSLPDGEPNCFAVQAYNVAGERSPLSDPISNDAAAGLMLIIDEPAERGYVSQPFAISGWAVDRRATNGPGIDTLHMYAYPASGGAPVWLGAAASGGTRPDVGALLGANFASSGYGLIVANLPAGDYQIVVFAHSAVTGGFDKTAVRSVTVLSAPLITLDGPGDGAMVSQPFSLDGWAIDPTASRGTGIDVLKAYAYPNPGSGAPPIFLGWASYGGQRADVAATYGGQFLNSRFQVAVDGLLPGIYMLEVHGRSIATQQFTVAQRVTVNVKGRPRMNIDIPADQSTVPTSFIIAGWAIDLESTSGAGVDAVHVYAFPTDGSPAVFLGAATLILSRPDVAAAFAASQHESSGFSLYVPSLAPGVYDIFVYTRSTVTGGFNNVQIRRVTVQ